MQLVQKLIASAALLALAGAVQAAPVIIDDFEVASTASVYDGTINGTGQAKEDSGATTSIIGGYRDIYVAMDSGTTGLIQGVYGIAENGKMSFITGDQTTGVGIIRWDGDSSAAGHNNSMDGLSAAAAKTSIAGSNGFAATDLTSAGQNVSILVTATADLIYSLEFQLYDADGDMASVTKTGTNQGAFTFAEFALANGNLNFTTITAAQMIINFQTLTQKVDVTIDIVQAVPEPGSIALAGLALLGLGLSRRRRA